MDEKEKAPVARAADRVARTPKKRGRPTRYSPKVLETAERMAKSGATLEEIARAVGTTRKNLYRWASRFDEFRHTLKTAGVEADERVQHSLYQRAVGYEVKTEKIFKDGDGSIIRVETTEHVPPDVTAQIFWLKNRCRGRNL